MKQITVETTGNFMLLDRFSGREIMPGEKPTVPLTMFIEERLKLKQLREVDDDAPVQEQEPQTQSDAPVREQPPVDTDKDGHNDKTGEFVAGNKEAAKPARTAGKRGK